MRFQLTPINDNKMKAFLYMKKSFLILMVLLLQQLTLKAQTTVTDIDGNVYHTVTIGTQVWLVENLKTTHYRDGTAIPNVTDGNTWDNLTTGAYCDYDNTPSNSDIYGRLYNWYITTNSHNICPKGWHVPSDAEWTTLITYLGGASVAGGKLKETGTTHWESPNTGATNETGFSALPGGTRYDDRTFGGIGYYGYWWSSTEYGTDDAWGRDVIYVVSGINRWSYGKTVGLSVRCLKD